MVSQRDGNFESDGNPEPLGAAAYLLAALAFIPGLGILLGLPSIGWGLLAPDQTLLNQPVERCDAILRFAAAKDSGVVHIQCGDVSPGIATEVRRK